MSPTIRQVLHETIAVFHHAHIDSPALTARMLLAQALGRPREWLAAHDDAALDESHTARIAALIGRVLAHEPLAYILGHREFYGIDLLVDPRVLIPRPETEILVDLALEHLRTQSAADAGSGGRRAGVIDVGTGSGAIAIAVCRNDQRVRVLATDISRRALELARQNARRCGCDERIQFVECDLLESLDVQADVITANLPYVTVEEIEALPPEIQEHEPRVALDGGLDGLQLVRRLLRQLGTHLRPAGLAVFEIGATQGSAALEAAQNMLPGWNAVLRKDLAGLDRVLAVQKTGRRITR